MFSWGVLTIAATLVVLAYYLNDGGPRYKLQRKPLTEYDYVIVGAGTSGCVLASRLTEDPDVTVLLIEAGSLDTSHPLHDVPMATRSLITTNITWAGLTVPQTHACLAMNNKRCRVLRGKVVGGSSTINSLVYQRGGRHDYDTWADDGATGWSYDEVLPYFMKAETNYNYKLSHSDYHGNHGPLIVSDVKSTSLPEAFLIAGKQLGYDTLDVNGESQQGFMHTQATISRGRRWSVTRGYLQPAMDRTNLHLVTNTLVHKVLFTGNKAVGVEYYHDNTRGHVLARKEVILAAGAIGTSQILLLSGVGPKDQLREHGIALVSDLPVGLNLQDHITLREQEYVIKEPIAITTYKMTTIWAWFDYVVFGTGWWSNVLSEGSAFISSPSSDDDNRPDIQISMAPLLLGNDPTTITTEQIIHNYDEQLYDYLHSGCDRRDGFGLYTTLLRPYSRGTVKLQSSDPRDPPLVDPRYLSDPRDLHTMIQGIGISEKLSDTDMLRRHLGAEPFLRVHPRCAGERYGGSAYWDCYLRHNAVPDGHYAGTCRMGRRGDKRAVVDSHLRVLYTEGLRVVDASIMPTITAGNTYIPTVMIAEKAADLIRGKVTVNRVNVTRV